MSAGRVGPTGPGVAERDVLGALTRDRAAGHATVSGEGSVEAHRKGTAAFAPAGGRHTATAKKAGDAKATSQPFRLGG